MQLSKGYNETLPPCEEGATLRSPNLLHLLGLIKYKYFCR